jgi:hypothetical protein
MNKKYLIIISLTVFFLIVSIVFNLLFIKSIASYLTRIKILESNNLSIQKQLNEIKERGQGDIMMQKNWECKWNCSNYLLQNDLTKKTNFNNKCHEDCRKELDRVALEIRLKPLINLEDEYDISFFQKYKQEDISVVYKMINWDLGKLTGNIKYNFIFAEHVYEFSNLGYRVVPFPYIEEDGEIKEVKGLEDIFFNKSGELINCLNDESITIVCEAIKNINGSDRAENMLLDCGSRQCTFLEAIRTNTLEKCSYINQYTVAPSDVEWIDFCEKTVEKDIKENLSSCKYDSECMVVDYSHCCGLSKIAINLNYLKYYNNHPEWQKFDDPQTCAVIGMCPDDSSAKEAVCEIGKCKLKIKEENLK